ncbi:MAG TPA: LuxR C-terminal-related transcriptional regulator [Usitatibacteraceae bacterium]|nr:LuxR C-terminal-related transcriptional regulator [Usitatibacteraceae bacterium]
MTALMQFSDTEIQLLQLLSSGLSCRDIAGRMGLTEGTTRVYLHHLYRKGHFHGRASAAAWFQKQSGRANESARAKGCEQAHRTDVSFGEIAMRSGLQSALGAMNIFLGPHSRAWEVAARLRGTEGAESDEGLRKTSRTLWDALLAGNWQVAKQASDDGTIAALLVQSPVDYAVGCAMLALGGYTFAAEGALQAYEGRKGKAMRLLKRSEIEFLVWLRDHERRRAADPESQIPRFLGVFASNQVFRQLAVACAFHLNARWGTRDEAVRHANDLWREAILIRQQLQDFGDDVLAGSLSPLRAAAAANAPVQATELARV